MNQEEIEEKSEEVLKTVKKTWENKEKKNHYEDNPDSYAYGINRYKMAWLFVSGSVLGYVGETLWYLYLRGHLVNRQGVLFGPFSPIYGFMFVLLTGLLYKDRDKSWKRIFVVSMISVTAFEYACSWSMEHVLGTKSWSYVNKAFNLNGRVCLQMSIMWGILGIVYIKIIYPTLSRTIESFKPKIGKIVGMILCWFLIIDSVFSIVVSLRQTERRNGITANGVFEEWIDEYYTDDKLAEIYTEIRVVDKERESNVSGERITL